MATVSILNILQDSGILSQVIVTDEIGYFLDALQKTEINNDAPFVEGIREGKVDLAVAYNRNPFGSFGLNLASPALFKDLAFKLQILKTPKHKFRLWVAMPQSEPVKGLFSIAKDVAGFALKPAKVEEDIASGEGRKKLVMEEDDLEIVLKGISGNQELVPSITVNSSSDRASHIGFVPGMDENSPEGIVHFGFKSEAVTFGGTGVGFTFDKAPNNQKFDGFYIDDSDEASALSVWPENPPDDIKAVQWRGLVAPKVIFYLPPKLPIFGGRAINGHFAIGIDGSRSDVVIESKVASTPDDPGFEIRIECRDKTAIGLAGLVPTNITSTVEFPISEKVAKVKDDGDGQIKPLQFGSDKPVKITLNLSRDPLNPVKAFSTKLSIASSGENGILSVHDVEGGGISAAKLFVTAAGMATAIIADKDVNRQQKVGKTDSALLYGLLAVAAPATNFFEKGGKFILQSAEFETSGVDSPIDGAMVLQLDYTVALSVKKLTVAGFGVSMDSDRPMRIRVKDLRMSYNPEKAGLEKFAIDFDQSRMEIADAGHWNLEGLDSLFDILGTRSGHGSSWMEIDLGFKLNLGPIHVSKTTIRIEMDSNGNISGTIRGLKAGIEVPKLIEGSGQVQLADNGFGADFSAKLIPLNVGATASFAYKEDKEFNMIFVGLGVDLPAPIPLANSGFGLFGIGGNFGNNAEPNYDNIRAKDEVTKKLKWRPNSENFRSAKGSNTFGLIGVIGTLPDLGFSFSAQASLQVTAPDVSIRAGLNGRVLQPAFKLSDQIKLDGEGLSFLGMLTVDSSALTIGILGAFNLRPLLEARAPLAGYFPFGATSNQWYVYLGADGYNGQGRNIGPITVRILPRYLNAGADAYAMMNGNGFEAWPNRQGIAKRNVTGGFAVALGFSLQQSFGFKPIAWAELYASVDLLLATKPLLLAGFGRASGGLHLGPFSLSVSAQLSFAYSKDEEYIWVQVTGKIELFFFDIEGTVTISFGNKDEPNSVPAPDRHPLDKVDKDGNVIGILGALSDDTYRVIASPVEKFADLRPENDVWPDCLISIPFGITPVIPPAIAPQTVNPAFKQFPGINGANAPKQAGITGTEMLRYVWTLEKFGLFDVTDVTDPATQGFVAPGGFAARWQQPRGSSGNVEFNELVLFSTGTELWINRLADAGEGLRNDPLLHTANICKLPDLEPQDGWSVGVIAELRNRGYFLPTDPLDLGPYASRIDAEVAVYFVIGFVETASNSSLILPPEFRLVPASLIVLKKQIKLFGREFKGYLELESVRHVSQFSIAGRGNFQKATLKTAEKIHNGKLILMIRIRPDDGDWRHSDGFVSVKDELGNRWQKTTDKTIDTSAGPSHLLVFEAPAGSLSNTVIVEWLLGIPLGIVGLGGVTDSASKAVKQENDANKEEAKNRADAARAGPKVTVTTNDPKQRAILTPGHIYRVDIGMKWDGTLTKRDASGNALPAITGTGVEPRSFYFRIADKSNGGYEAPERLAHLFKTNSRFHPEMLIRYLGGYEPRQSQEYYFCDDPLKVTFTQDHIVALAKAYGHDLELVVRRTDRHAAKPVYLFPFWAFGDTAEFLTFPDQRRFQLAAESSCEQPKPGLSGSGNMPLDAFAPYELYVRAKDEYGNEDGKLDGVTFKTSRYRSPLDMCSQIGLSTSDGLAPLPVISGDLQMPANATFPNDPVSSDLAFQQALGAIGIPDWPPILEPRFSRLWSATADGMWNFNGLMIELPEPLARPGRLDLKGLLLDMGTVGQAITFRQIRADRLGARLLFITDTPFKVVTSEPQVFQLQPLNIPPVVLDLDLTRQTPIGGRIPLLRKRRPTPPRGGGVVLPKIIVPKLVLDLFDVPAGRRILASMPLPASPNFAGDL
jgi:hypothetical protein